jgi:heme/copper-type cytochrome/quinol oxidase subunit 2
MSKKIIYAVLCAIALIGGLVGTLYFLTQGSTITVLDTKGPLGQQERTVMIVATVISLAIIIPVFITTFVMAWRYRASSTKAHMTDWDQNATGS